MSYFPQSINPPSELLFFKSSTNASSLVTPPHPPTLGKINYTPFIPSWWSEDRMKALDIFLINVKGENFAHLVFPFIIISQNFPFSQSDTFN